MLCALESCVSCAVSVFAHNSLHMSWRRAAAHFKAGSGCQASRQGDALRMPRGATPCVHSFLVVGSGTAALSHASCLPRKRGDDLKSGRAELCSLLSFLMKRREAKQSKQRSREPRACRTDWRYNSALSVVRQCEMGSGMQPWGRTMEGTTLSSCFLLRC